MGSRKPRHEPGRDKPPANGHDPVFYPANWRDSIVMERNTTKKKVGKLALFCTDLIAIIMLLKFFIISDHTMQVIAWIFSCAWLAVRITHNVLKVIVFYAKNKSLIKQLRKKWKTDFIE